MKHAYVLGNLMVFVFMCKLSNAVPHINVYDSSHNPGNDDPANSYSQTDSDNTVQTKTEPFKRAGLDRYRFFGFGLGKRSKGTADTEWIRPGYFEDSLQPRDTESRSRLPSLFSMPKDQLQRYLTDVLAANADRYTNIATSKRVPEVYEEKFYPVQAGKQQMEVKIDNSLKNATYDFFRNSDKYQDDASSEENDSNPLSKSLKQSRELQVVPGSRITRPSKRWWAASRLASLRIPNSSRKARRRWGKMFIDPALYFMGLGR